MENCRTSNTGPQRTRSLVALPDNEYLERIGEVAYTVASMEWTILGDLLRLSSRLPEGLTLNRLEPKTTAEIAKDVKNAAKTADDVEIKNYLVAVYRGLFEASEIRNNLLHARPATNPQQGQRLYRSETHNSQTTGRRFWIDGEWFDDAISKLNNNLRAVEHVRPKLLK